MFHVKTHLAESELQGIGLFSGEQIKKGTSIYSHNSELDINLSKEKFESLDSSDKKFIMHYGYFNIKTDKWHLSWDNIRFCNHSYKPNMQETGNKICAIRDIQKGEELTQNYEYFENPIRDSRGIKNTTN